MKLKTYQKMRRFLTFGSLILFILLVACINNQSKPAMEHMTDSVFQKGDKIASTHFTGTAWLQMLVNNDSTYNTSIGVVTFEPKARTNWHKHPGGQILLVTDGKGYYQEKGKSVQFLHKGDVVKIPPNTEHWHGAAPDKEFIHIAVSPRTEKGSVVWLQPVTDEEYNRIIQ